MFGGLVILYWLTLDYSIIVSRSMSPTLEGTNIDNGDRVITEKITRWYRPPRRWEVITFLSKEGEKIMNASPVCPAKTCKCGTRASL